MLSAQELTIKDMSATNDLSASQYRRNDINGEPCALIKVQLATEGATFEGNVITPVDYKSGEYWVYMTKGSKEMRIKHPKFLPCHVTFGEFGINNGVTSLTTYTLTLLMPGNAPVQKQKLIVNYTPKNAMVIINSKTYSGDGHVELELPIGSYDYQVAAVGYTMAEGTVKLNASGPRTITESLSRVEQDGLSDIGQNTPNEIKQEKKNTNSLSPHIINDDANKSGEDVTSTFSVAYSNNLITKKFDYVYKGVEFKCKGEGRSVCIVSFSVKAENVVIPATVMYKGEAFPVKSISTFLNGVNYLAKTLVVEEGIEDINKYSFNEFRKLKQVTLPSTIKHIGKNAFRDNDGLIFNNRSTINEQLIRDGDECWARGSR